MGMLPQESRGRRARRSRVHQEPPHSCNREVVRGFRNRRCRPEEDQADAGLGRDLTGSESAVCAGDASEWPSHSLQVGPDRQTRLQSLAAVTEGWAKEVSWTDEITFQSCTM